MGEPRAITYKEVKKVAGSDASAGEMWRKIGDITGAGHVPAGEDAAISLTDVSDAKRGQIDRLLGTEDDAQIVEDNKNTKRGK